MGNGSLTPIFSLSERSLSPTLTVLCSMYLIWESSKNHPINKVPSWLISPYEEVIKSNEPGLYLRKYGISNNDELSSSFAWLEIFCNSVSILSTIRHKKFRRMRIKCILKRIWLNSFNQVKLKLKLSLWQTIFINIW